MTGLRGRAVLLALAAFTVLPLVAAGPGAAAAVDRVSAPAAGVPRAGTGAEPAIPLMAFYYQWFDVSSWNRAKIDYPLLGRYSSDDPAVMREHIRLAQAAGINGFIVSWKDTPSNDRRLQLLMQAARPAGFKLAMIYQGLDFHRRPLPIATVAADLRMFATQFAPDPVFLRLGGKPLTIWSGTWAFSRSDVALATAPVRSIMLVLNTEKNVDGYRRIADLTDGNAYYWSSVNPATNTNYAPKLAAMSQAVHAGGRYWIAPLAAGFDARLVGGTSVVDRRDGQTLRSEYATAVASSPDLLGLISWNEFSENSYVEPSRSFGRRYLDVLQELRRTPAPQPTSALDSSEPPPASGSSSWSRQARWNLLLLGGFLVALFGGVALLRPAAARRDARRSVRRSAPVARTALSARRVGQHALPDDPPTTRRPLNCVPAEPKDQRWPVLMSDPQDP
jgi:hypothetical protein